MNEIERAAIEARLAAITPGEWRAVPASKMLVPWGTAFHRYGVETDETAIVYSIGYCSLENAEFIAHAPDDLRTLLDALDAATARVAALERIETAAHDAFNALSRDNTYSPGPTAAWKILGDALDRVGSEDDPRRARDGDGDAPPALGDGS